MRRSVADFGPIHFVGIGGIGMSGIAEIMIDMGYRVQGSDVRAGPTTQRLEGLGAHIHIGHDALQIGQAAIVVVSTAIGPDNPEVQAARSSGIPVVHRSDMLAELTSLKPTLAVAGTHGKTTTTSLIATLLDGIGSDPTVINGGIINAYGSNAKTGSGDWVVVEADESDGSFTRLRPRIAVITNIDAEHMDHYPDMDALRCAFDSFVRQVPVLSFVVLCTDNPELARLAERFSDRHMIRCGFADGSDVQAGNLRHQDGRAVFDVTVHPRDGALAVNDRQVWSDMSLSLIGEHNIQNALAAIAVAYEFGGHQDDIRQALDAFTGVRRRFTLVGTQGGISIYDDYAHHPVEIAAVLKATRDISKTARPPHRVVAIVQPHRYSRLDALMNQFCQCFADADLVLIAPVYAAGETQNGRSGHQDLVDGLRQSGHRAVHGIARMDQLIPEAMSFLAPGDIVVCLGAGDISAYASLLANTIAAREPRATLRG